MAELIVELFSEEIPARMQAGAARDFERMATERLTSAGLSWRSLQTFVGPRRLTLVVDGLPMATPDREEEIKGPKASAPEQALEGFLRKTGLTRDQLVERDGVLFAVISQTGRQTADVVAEMVEQIVRTFPWPKSMRWGTGSLRWVRPLKRILCTMDGQVVPFEIDGIVSGNVTEGHRFMGSGQPFKVIDFDAYRGGLADEFVRIDSGERAYVLDEAAYKICREAGLELVADQGLLDEVAGLAEWPTPILGDMDPSFLDLPPEVIRLSMKVHQKYFAVRDPKTGGLAPNFIVVANVEASDGGKALAAGNSRVLSARLNDARFFWDEDRKVGFESWNEKLKGVTFHARLGTMWDRVERIAALAREIAPLVGADPDQAFEAARLCKADLASGMVGEFPELQGVMGGYYARLAGYPDAVADAVRDHYKPQGPSDTVPTAPVTVAVALADKLDSLAGFWSIDEKPTGSKDPFALRRAALGVIRLVLVNEVRTSVDRLFDVQVLRNQIGSDPLDGVLLSRILDAAVENGMYGERTRVLVGEAEVSTPDWLARVRDHDPAISDDLRGFLHDRLKVELRDQNIRHDIIDACLDMPGNCDLTLLVRRVRALAAFLATDDGVNLLAGYKRASQLLKAEEKKGDLPQGEATVLDGASAEEATLIGAAQSASGAVDAALAGEDFAGAMTALAALRAPVDAFFDKVMVNSDVTEERDNRLRLLGQVRAVMGRVADFGQIAG